jgi:ABC-type nitrate/sulfonate/bicarbonate transport system permease component
MARQPPTYLRPFAEQLALPSYLRMLFFRYVGALATVFAMLVLEFSILAENLFVMVAGVTLSMLSLGVARSLSASGALSWLKNDPRRPILYLRSFSTDLNLRQTFLWMMGRSSRTYEQSLAKALLPLGPLVAIGKPGEVLPPSGAVRLYIDHDRWQNVVEQLVVDSQLVILRIGETEGFRWEIKHLVTNCDPQKVLIFIPSTDAELYRSFCSEAKDAFPIDLPVETGGARFLGFGPSWQPILVGAPKNVFQAAARFVFKAPIWALADALAELPGVRQAAAATHITPPKSRLLPWTSVLVGIFVWELLGETGNLFFNHGTAWPTPIIIAPALVNLVKDQATWLSLGISAMEFLTGYCIAVPLALAIGYLMAQSDHAERILRPWIFWFYAMPAMALLPAVLLLAGLGFPFVVSVVVLMVLFPVVMNTADALPTPLERLRGISRTSRVPKIMAGLKFGIERGLIGVAAAEMLGGRDGLVGQIILAATLFDMPTAYAGMVVFSGLGVALIGAFSWIETLLARLTTLEAKEKIAIAGPPV